MTTHWLVLAPIPAQRLHPRAVVTLAIGERVRDLCWQGANLCVRYAGCWLVIPYGAQDRLEMVDPRTNT